MRQICVRFASDNYDRWAEIHWKKQLEKALALEEERELEELERENMKVIEQVYNSMKDNKEIQKWIEKIKFHEWIKTIEGKDEKGTNH